jgi:hypothetical protein
MVRAKKKCLTVRRADPNESGREPVSECGLKHKQCHRRVPPKCSPPVPTFALQSHCPVKDIILNEGQKLIDLLHSEDRGIREKSKEIAHFCANVSTKKPLGPCLGLSNKVFCGPLWTCPCQKLHRASEQKPSLRTVGRLESRSASGQAALVVSQ